jgi:GTP cyclohydrolase FolE2
MFRRRLTGRRQVKQRGRSQNFESIHNHSAYALIERDKAKADGRA